MKIVGLLGAVLLTVCILFVVVLTRAEVSSTTYASYGDAARANALGEGKWLPGNLPKSATGIHETHDVDTNEVWFAYQAQMLATPVGCQQVAWREVPLPHPQRSPSEFLQELEDSRRSSRTSAYACIGEEYRYHLAYDAINKRAYGWSRGD